MDRNIALLLGLQVVAQAAHDALAKEHGHGHPSVLATMDALAAIERAIEWLESSSQP